MFYVLLRNSCGFIAPASEEMIAMLLTVGFVQTPGRPSWLRQIEGGSVTAMFEQRAEDRVLTFSVSPHITSMDGHAAAAQAASLAFKVADRIAEKFDAALIHDSNISYCKEERGGTQGLLAAYPDIPFRFEALCLGFRNLFSALQK